MNLNERYKARHAKRIKRFLSFYSFLALFLFSYNTLARYMTVSTNTITTDVAKWTIQINNIEIINNTQEISNVINLVPSSETKTTENKLAPGQSGYFDIIINPTGTEVAVEYTITINATNIPTGITFKEYELNNSGTMQTVVDNTITGQINLNDNLESMTATESQNLRIYWEWTETEDDSLPTGTENYYITATINIKQKI